MEKSCGLHGLMGCATEAWCEKLGWLHSPPGSRYFPRLRSFRSLCGANFSVQYLYVPPEGRGSGCG